jgi:BirA family biotin operon repressor/biotin-[acetyl-CoA-carboxylase] ligase
MIPSRPRLPPAYRLVFYDTVGSTNDEAKRLARDAAKEGTVVWALRQSAGRGRAGHLWASPPGNLYASLIVLPRCSLNRAAQLSFVAALAIGDTLGAISQKPLEGLSYKWPNDVLVHGRKTAGILLESELSDGEMPEFVVVGVGINLASSPAGADFPATSVVELGLGCVSAADALGSFAHHFQAWVRRWRENGFAQIREAWLAHAMSLGERIRVRLNASILHGRFVDIDQHGALLLEAADGIRQISAGQVFPAVL